MSEILCTLAGEHEFTATVIQEDDGRVHFKADADIDADGAPHAYSPHNNGLDDLRNAKDLRGNFVGVLTDKHGEPLVQASDDPAPGYYISTTTYEHRDQPENTQRRYVNAETAPFIVVSPLIRQRAKGIVLGCKARVTYNGKSIDAVVADIGPRSKAGEISIEAAKRLGIPSSPKTGGIDDGVVLYELWPGEAAVIDSVVYELQPA